MSLIVIACTLCASLVASLLIFRAHSKSLKRSAYDLSAIGVQDNLIPVAIIGGGPAGLTAAIYTARSHMKTIIFAGFERGGQLAHVKHIENWPARDKATGTAIIKDLEEQAKKFGATLVHEEIKHVDLANWPFKLTSNEGTECYALSIIIATGGQAKKLNVPGVEEYLGKGVSSCAICDAPFNKDQNVVVIGGGDTAGELALQVAAYAKSVTLIVRETSLQACATVQGYLKACKNLTIEYSAHLEEIKGDGSTPTSILISNVQTGKKQEIPAKAVYFGIGYKPTSDLFKPTVQTDKEGYILVQGRSQRTSVPGVIAAGSVEDKGYSKAGVAAGNGIKAALDALAFLESIGLTAYKAQELESYFYVKKPQQTSDITLITSEKDLNAIISTSKVPVIVDFFAYYCPSCIYLMPFIESRAAQAGSRAHFCKVDVDQSSDLAEKLAINTLPTIVIFKNGVEYARYRHICSKSKLDEFLAPLLSEHDDASATKA